MTAAGFQQAIIRARSIIRAHPAVVGDDPPVYDKQTDTTQISVTIEVNLANKWWAEGESPSGVRRCEVVRLDFPTRLSMAAARGVFTHGFFKKCGTYAAQANA